jgi:succinoglycan biosynthesis protein ExoV
MKLFYHQAAGGNFGDDLNGFLWPQLLGRSLDQSGDVTLVAIGSILDTRLDSISGRKIIFGTGIASQRRLPAIGKNYDIRFVRGPVSAHAIGRDCPWISDSAIAVRLLDWPKVIPSYNVGFMPHFITIPYLDWPKVCENLGFRYISPQLPVEQILSELRSCKSVITEAMHGAIICDAFRVPWMRVTINSWQREDFDISALKWLDWGLSVKADVTPVHLEPLHQWGRRMLVNPVRLADRIKAQRKLIKDLAALPQTENFQLSNESVLREATERIGSEIARLKTGAGAV